MVLFVVSRGQEYCPVVRDWTRKTTQTWISKILGLGKQYVLRYTDDVSLYTLISTRKDLKLVALGDEAAKELDDMVLPYFKLPDPSPKNQFLRKKVQVEAVLEECKRWLR